ncbi:plastocyanin/azurin family copper-binding protein [Candidatus Poseidonia sp.]|nr:plastocyanin/azurin family copper-binding protein [Poseidonia sp.]
MRTAVALCLALLLLAPLQGDLTPVEDTLPLQDQSSNETIITVDSTNLRFSPSSVTVSEGETVRFFWSGQALPHNAVEANGVFNSGDPERNVDYAFTFELGMNGTYDFVCEPHAALGMVGQIIVDPAPTPPPANQSDNQTNESQDEDMDTPALPVVMALATVLLAAAVRTRRD